MTESEQRVTFRKQVSDGNYGSEVAEATVFAGDDTDEAIAAALATARRLVHQELRQSPSAQVRRALDYPPHEREERWRQAEQSAEVELAAGLRDNARSNYDDDEDIPL
ncbi:MAG TPA: hypothetical protein VNG35_12270 [Gemmatimonadales bacterium]|nr:hypothetical protein [Gemmatimonadales bacterium]